MKGKVGNTSPCSETFNLVTMFIEAFEYDTIWKFQLWIMDEQQISMPGIHKVLDFQIQNGNAVIWAAVDSKSIKEPKTFRIVGTGNPFPQGDDLNYIGTAQDDNFVWHLFEEV